MRTRLLLLGWLLIAPVASLARVEPALPATVRPAALREVAFEQRIGAMLPIDLVLRDETGRPVRLGDQLGTRPLVIVPAYFSCPMLCRLVLNGVVSALWALPLDVGRDFSVLTWSFDPRDTPEAASAKKREVLERYRRPGAEDGWHFLTGDEASAHELGEAIGFRPAWDETAGQYAHASGLVVVTPAGRISHYLYGVEFSPRDLRLALVEASAGTLGTPVDRLLLFCFRYDPATGRYSRLAFGAVRWGGAFTMLLLAGTVIHFLRRERRAER